MLPQMSCAFLINVTNIVKVKEKKKGSSENVKSEFEFKNEFK